MESIFGKGGFIALNHPSYEYRRQQTEMAKAVQNALNKSKHLIVEAGTGVGKSFAYLIPAIYYAVQNKKKVIISTYTISLQEQLVFKDVPFLKKILPFEFNVSIVKGRSNYLSLRRLNQALLNSDDLFENKGHIKELKYILEWSKTTTDGSMSDMEMQPSHIIWDKVCSDSDNCMARKCVYFKECFFYKQRTKMQKADILVVNHHLFFTHLGLSQAGHPILPDYGAVIFDEAHNIERVATEYLGIQLTNTGVKYLLDQLYNPKRKKGVTMRLRNETLQSITIQAHKEAESFFKQAQMRLKNNDALRIKTEGFLEDTLSPKLKEMVECLTDGLKHSESKEEETEIRAYIKKLKNLNSNLETMITQRLKDYVYWIECHKRRFTKISLNASSIEISNLLNQFLFAKPQPVIMTSATLSIEGSFDYFKKRIGVKDADELILDSTFDYKKQVTLYISRNTPNPDRGSEYLDAIIKDIEYYIGKIAGGAFVLFTSYRVMDEAYSRLSTLLDEKGIRHFKQGDGLSINKILIEFKKDGHAALFGTDSFWQGIDVPGEALSCIVITKLPFSVPDHPVVEARMEKIQSCGNDPFLEYSLPEAILKLKQGFGRLIRHRQDKGIVAILDSRILSRFYGRHFLKTLPECEVVVK